MNADTMLFFADDVDAFFLYARLEDEILKRMDDVCIKTRKTQISFYNRHLFACVSFIRISRKKDCPEHDIVVTFGLDHKLRLRLPPNPIRTAGSIMC